jgi:hypothetical protein
MRISTYALATNPKYANFNPFNWQGLAGQLGTKASKALSTPVGAAKLGAGIGAGIGAINYLGSDDKSIGNLAGQVGGGAALGGAAGYGGSRLKNAWQARKTAQVGNQQLLAPAASTMPQPQTPIQTSNGQPIQTAPPKQQAQLPAAQPVQRPQPIQNGVITTPVPASQQTIDVNSSAIVPSTGYQPPKSMPTKNADGVYDLANPTTKGVGTEQSMPLSQQKRLDQRRKKYSAGGFRSGNMKPELAVDADGKAFNRNISPFANFKVRRYKGFVY